MQIHKITISKGDGSLLSPPATALIYEKTCNESKINIIVMPNTSGKSLIFNSLEHLISGNKDKFIKDTDRDLITRVEFSINEDSFVYKGAHGNPNKITKNGEEFTNLENLIRGEMGLSEGRLEYFGKNKNSLHSIARFYFFDFHGISERESSNKISFIDARYDGRSKRLLLAYVLGAGIDNAHFRTITEIEYKEAFIETHRRKFEAIHQHEQQILNIDDNIKELFQQLEEERISLGDISVAIGELQNLINRYQKIHGVDTEDFFFLRDQITFLENEKKDIHFSIQTIRQKIKEGQIIEMKTLGKQGKGRKNTTIQSDAQIYEQYIQYKNDIAEIDLMAIESYLASYVDPILGRFKYFLNELYNVFLKNALEQGIFTENDGLMEYDNIDFNEKTLEIEAFFTTSEGTRKTIRLLTFMGMQLFFNNSLCNSFYDSCLENIDPAHRGALFNSFYEFLELKQLQLPNMFIFVTQIETMQDKDGLFPLKQNYKKYLNIHYSKGLHELN